MNLNSDYLIKVFVFGTLRKGGRLDYYMEGSKFIGNYYTEGQLMKSETGSAFIDFDQKGIATLGELYIMNYSGLLRIDHLESTSGEFPKGYDLDIVPIHKFTEKPLNFNKESNAYAFVYKRRNNPQKIVSGDWIKRIKPIDEIKNFLNKNKNKEIDPEDLISYMQKYLIK